ncbi:sodium-dependent nutrient amino acid transporter 1 [Anabrus simplex]|uniref:sodium-dependent nutrient amino acid transporter 1 n=1 Tax=Anabrus simplex TaxID=316456 RepID=UPI0035A279E2
MRGKKDSYNVNGSVELGAVNPTFVGDSEPPDNGKAANGHSVPHLGDGENSPSSIVSKEPLGATEESGPERQQWSNGVEFLMSCIAMSVGLGNIWRFPFTAYENGGGAFVIPYIIVLLVIGKPLYYLEMVLGQFTGYGCVKAWNMIPALKGMGFGQVFATAMVLTYYCALMALTVFYFFASFTAELPWSRCGDWSGDNCLDSVNDGNTSLANKTLEIMARLNLTGNDTKIQSSSELYFLKFVLNEPPTIEDGVGGVEWRLTLCLLFSWITIYLVIMRGVQSSGKAAYFLALFPYVVLTALLIRGATLEGALNGVLYFITPQWEKLVDPNVWYAAVSQAFFSLGVCFGTLIVYSSYNDFHHNIHRDAIIVTTMDTFTSLLAGCTIFSILGNLAHELGMDVKDVVKGGTGLAFISYPDAIAKFDAVPQLFSVLFFFMLYTLGIGSAVALVGAVIATICDQWPQLKYWLVALVACSFGFLVGLVYITPGGQFILTLVDEYAVTLTVFILGCVEMAALAWLYGVDNFCQDIEFMLGHRVSVYWRLCWSLVTPVLLLVILFYKFAKLEPLTYQGSLYPDSAYAAGWILFAVGIIAVPIGIGYEFMKSRHLPFLEMVKTSFKPNELWRPRNTKDYEEWLKFKEDRRQEMELVEQSMGRRILRNLCGLGCGKAKPRAAH